MLLHSISPRSRPQLSPGCSGLEKRSRVQASRWKLQASARSLEVRVTTATCRVVEATQTRYLRDRPEWRGRDRGEIRGLREEERKLRCSPGQLPGNVDSHWMETSLVKRVSTADDAFGPSPRNELARRPREGLDSID